MAKKISQYLGQVDNNLIAVKPCMIILQLSDYVVDDSLQINKDDGNIWVKALISKIEFEDIFFNLILDYPVSLQTQFMEQNTEEIKLKYMKNDIILEIPLTTVEIKEQVNYVQRLLGGKEIYKDPSHLVKKLYDIYGGISDLDLVHLEVLASQVLRYKEDPSIPARLGKKWDPVMTNIKNDVFNTGFLQGLAFENVGKAIDLGLTTSRDTQPSVLERVLTGELVKEKGRKK